MSSVERSRAAVGSVAESVAIAGFLVPPQGYQRRHGRRDGGQGRGRPRRLV